MHNLPEASDCGVIRSKAALVARGALKRGKVEMWQATHEQLKLVGVEEHDGRPRGDAEKARFELGKCLLDRVDEVPAHDAVDKLAAVVPRHRLF